MTIRPDAASKGNATHHFSRRDEIGTRRHGTEHSKGYQARLGVEGLSCYEAEQQVVPGKGEAAASENGEVMPVNGMKQRLRRTHRGDAAVLVRD